MFSFLCPKQFWTEHDETLYKGLSSNEFLRGRIRKLSSLNFFSYFFFLPFLFSFFLGVFCPFFKWVHGQLGVHLITQGRWVVNFRSIICPKLSYNFEESKHCCSKNNLLGVLLFVMHLKNAK